MKAIVKTCPRCGKKFECFQDNINLCFCSKIKISSEKINFIKERYSDCLCPKCLNEIANNSSIKNL